MNSNPLALANNNQSAKAYLTFRVGAQWYAVNVDNIFEVSNLVAISEVPDMPPSVLGVVNIRGLVVPILDLRRRFKLAQNRLDLTTPIIFLQKEAGVCSYGIVVDDVDDVMSLKPEQTKQTELTQRARHIIGMTDYRDKLVMLLDPRELLASSLNEQETGQLLTDGKES